MRIAVIAANGRLGTAFVEEALQAGHSVNAGVLGAHSLQAHPKLNIFTCDATKAEDLMQLFQDQNVVVSALGHVKGSPPFVQTNATKATLSAMKSAHINRYVDVTGTGVRFEGDRISTIDRLLNLGVSLADPSRVRDGREHQEVLKQSDIDWTTIRVLKLQNVAPRPFRLTLHGPTKWFVGRREVAQAMREVIEQGSYLRAAPIISKR